MGRACLVTSTKQGNLKEKCCPTKKKTGRRHRTEIGGPSREKKAINAEGKRVLPLLGKSLRKKGGCGVWRAEWRTGLLKETIGEKKLRYLGYSLKRKKGEARWGEEGINPMW